MKAPVLMSQTEQDAYAAFLLRFAGKLRGSVADWLRQAAKTLRNEGGFYDQF